MQRNVLRAQDFMLNCYRDLRERIVRQLGAIGQRVEAVRHGNFGLVFDEPRRTVTRDGYDADVSLLKSAQAWDLLLALEAAGTVPLDRRALAERCRKRTKKNSLGDDESVLRTALHALRQRIEPLGITAKSIPGVGVTLIETQAKRPKRNRKTP